MKRLIIASLIATSCLANNATTHLHFNKENVIQYAQETYNAAKGLSHMHEMRNIPDAQYSRLTNEAQAWKCHCDLRLYYTARALNGENVYNWYDVLESKNLQELEELCLNPIRHALESNPSYSEKNSFERLRDQVKELKQQS